MDKKKLESLVTEKVKEIIKETELEVVSVEYVKERAWYLRIFLDKPEGVDLEDCQFVSRQISDWLDEEDVIPTEAYHLEVSSPGTDRPLTKAEDLARHQGDLVEISCFAPWEGKKLWCGILESETPDGVTIQVDGNPIEIPSKKIAKIRLHME